MSEGLGETLTGAGLAPGRSPTPSANLPRGRVWAKCLVGEPWGRAEAGTAHRRKFRAGAAMRVGMETASSSSYRQALGEGLALSLVGVPGHRGHQREGPAPGPRLAALLGTGLIRPSQLLGTGGMGDTAGAAPCPPFLRFTPSHTLLPRVAGSPKGCPQARALPSVTSIESSPEQSRTPSTQEGGSSTTHWGPQVQAGARAGRGSSPPPPARGPSFLFCCLF